METIYCAGYTRVSSKEQIEGESLTTQRDSITEYARRNGFELTGIYSDEGISGGSVKERHALLKCLNDGMNGKFSVLIVHRLSRFGRNARELLINCEELTKSGIKFISVSENIDFGNTYGRAMLGLLSVIAELERDIIKEQMFENRLNKAKRFIPTSGSLPYGRLFNKKTETWSLDPEKASKIRWASEQYLNGRSLKDIANKLSISYANLLMTLKHRSGDKWEVNFAGQKIVYDIPRILPDEIIKQINDRLYLNKSAKHQVKEDNFLLAGLIRCDTCKHTLIGQNLKPEPKYQRVNSYRYYKHFRDNFNGKNCKAFHSVDADKIETAVLQTIFRDFWDIPSFEKAISESLPDESTINEIKARISHSEKELSVIDRELSKLVEIALSGTLRKDTIQARETALLERKLGTELKVINDRAELSSMPDPVVIRKQADDIRKRLLLKYSGKDRLSQMTYQEKRELLEYFFMGKDSSGTPYGIYIDKRGRGKNAKIDYFIYGKLSMGVATIYGDDYNFTGDVDAEIQRERKEWENNEPTNGSKNFPNIVRKRHPDYLKEIYTDESDACHTKTVQK